MTTGTKRYPKEEQEKLALEYFDLIKTMPKVKAAEKLGVSPITLDGYVEKYLGEPMRTPRPTVSKPAPKNKIEHFTIPLQPVDKGMSKTQKDAVIQMLKAALSLLES
jgi:hypothetical protein